MDPRQKVEEIEQKAKEAKERAFGVFMNQATIRILMSKLPETEPELLEALLKEAHSSGWNSGAGHNAVAFIEVLMKGKP